MSLPTTKVEIAFDSGFSTPEGSRTWTDVSAYVEGDQEISITYGRADELATPDPNTCSLTLDNRDGRFTPGKASSPHYPNVKKGKPVRLSVRYAADGSGNFLSANAASMETSIADWTAGGSVPPALAQSATHVDSGSQALRITWGTGGTFPLAQTIVTGLVVGRTYTAQARVWVTSGTPDVRLAIAGLGTGTATATKSAFASISITFVATQASHGLQVWPATAPTSGQQCWVDSVMVDEGSATGTFTTSAPPIYTRFMGYVNEWPVVWADGSDAASTVAITASSRRARMGQTAPLTSAIRAAYLATDPDAYWPMDEDTDIQSRAGQQVFLDITNNDQPGQAREALAAFASAAAAPIVHDGTLGPTDEESLVMMPAYTNSALLGTLPHYIGSGTTVAFNTTGGYVTVELVARISPRHPGNTTITLIDLFANDYVNDISLSAINHIDAGQGSAVAGSFLVRDPVTLAVLENEGDGSFTAYDDAADGQIHHYAFVLDSAGTVGRVYFDGVQIGTLSIANPMTARMTNLAIASDTYNADVWVGHAAIHDRALTGAEVLAHSLAATAASETDAERVIRVAGRIGIPADELDVETSVAQPLGAQTEAGRSAAEVIDEVATSTNGVAYDTRAGHLALQARNHRYNATSTFTLSAVLQEVGGDLTAKVDDRYLINTVEVTRSGTQNITSTIVDQDSVDEYGVYSRNLALVSISDQEVEAAAQDTLYRYADGGGAPRISQTSVDLANLSDAQRRLVLAADIGTRFTLGSLPAQASSDPMTLFLEGYSESITPSGHTLTMNTTPGDIYQNAFVLDDAVFGQLDAGNVIAY